MRYFNKNKAIIDYVKNRKVLHLGCVGFSDLEIIDRIKLLKDSLHFQISQIADVIGIDYSYEETSEKLH